MVNFKDAAEKIQSKAFGRFGKAVFNIENALSERGVDVGRGQFAEENENNR